MNTIRFLLLLSLILLFSLPLSGEEATPWEFELEGSVYFLPDDTYFNPVLSADKDRLHLEARINYEDIGTVSLFGGYTFHAGDDFELTLAPMVGAVAGNSYGVAPAFLFELTYRKFSFTSEGEYLISFADKESNFFYMWSELIYSPVEWFWFGAAGQRIRAYQTDLDLQRGFLIGFAKGNVAVTGYLMEPGGDNAYGIVVVGYGF